MRPKTRRDVYRPKTCKICYQALPQASTGRPRLTCGDRCRQIKRRQYDYAGWKDKRRREQALNRAEKQIRKWERKYGDLRLIPGYREDPECLSGMSLYDRLVMHLRRGWPVHECWTCGRPYLPDGQRSGTCSDTCAHKRRVYFKKLRANFYQRPRVLPDEMYPYIRDGKKLGVCAHCGDPFLPEDVRRKYCGEKCKDAAYWKRRPLRMCKWCGVKYRGRRRACTEDCAKRLDYRANLHCVRCRHRVKPGLEVWPNADTRLLQRHEKSVFCSERCRDKRLDWSPVQKICAACGITYTPKNPGVEGRQRYCTAECATRVYRRSMTVMRRAARPARFCAHCGDSLPADRAGWPYRYCSDGCQREAKAIRRAAVPRAIPVPVEWFGVRTAVGEMVGD